MIDLSDHYTPCSSSPFGQAKKKKKEEHPGWACHLISLCLCFFIIEHTCQSLGQGKRLPSEKLRNNKESGLWFSKVSLQPVVSASHWNLLEMQIHNSHSRSNESENLGVGPVICLASPQVILAQERLRPHIPCSTYNNYTASFFTMLPNKLRLEVQRVRLSSSVFPS